MTAQEQSDLDREEELRRLFSARLNRAVRNAFLSVETGRNIRYLDELTLAEQEYFLTELQPQKEKICA